MVLYCVVFVGSLLVAAMPIAAPAKRPTRRAVTTMSHGVRRARGGAVGPCVVAVGPADWADSRSSGASAALVWTAIPLAGAPACSVSLASLSCVSAIGVQPPRRDDRTVVLL